MALPTASHPASTPAQAATPGITPGTAAAHVQTPTTPGAEPHLFDDIDAVLLMRLYPHSKDPRHDAMAAGHAAHDAGLKLVAAQQAPIAEPEGMTGVVLGHA